MTARSIERLATSLVVGMMTLACGGGATDAPAPAQTPAGAPAAAASDAVKRNACGLIDRAEIEAIAGQPLTMLHNIEDEDRSTCELSDKDGALLVSMTVLWKGGKEQARVEQAALSMARQMLNDDEVDIEELTGSGKIRGLADKAYYSDVMPSWALKGDVLIQIISPRFPGSQTKQVFLAAVRKALSRLPSEG